MRRRGRWLLALLTVTLVAAGLALLMRQHDALRTLELATYDVRMDIRGSRPAPPDIVVVAIDEQTFVELGERWPFRRSLYARLLDRLRAAHVRLIGMDLQFTEGTEPDEDVALYNAVKRAKPVVLATAAVSADGRTNVFGGDDNVKAAGAVVGVTVYPVDPDGIKRRMPTVVHKLRSFPIAAADLLGGGPQNRDDGANWIDFRGPPGTFRTISFWRALRARNGLTGMRDAIVVVGASAPTLHDLHTTAAPGGHLMSGPELQANAIATARDGFPLQSVDSKIDVALILLLAAAAPLVAARFRQRWAFAAGFGALGALAVGGQVAFDAGNVIEITYPAVAAFVALAGSAGVAYADEHVERDRLRRLFADFDPEVVEAVLASDPGDNAVALDPEEIIGGYRVERIVGEGGMGVVYEATQLRLDRRVALKLIRPAVAANPVVRERFKRESRIAAAVEHPNVIPVYEAGEDDAILYIAMRFIPGDDLASVIAREGPVHPTRAVGFVTQIAGALDAAHAHGLVHRDVKPANALVARDGAHEHVYLTDFGLTKQIGSRDGLTRPGRFVGTLDYMAPEAMRGQEVGPASDVYALGCVLYELLTGQVPFPEEAEADVIVSHLETPPPPLRDAGLSGFDPIIERAMAKDPDARFRSAGTLAAEAEVVAAGVAGLHRSRSPGPHRDPPMTSAPTRPA